MPILEVEESNYVGPIPDDEVLIAEVTGVKATVKPFKDDQGNDIERMEFAFVVADETSQFHNTRVWGDTSRTFSNNPNCKLWCWSQAILGQELGVGDQLDTDDLVGEMCRIVVKQRVQKGKDGAEDKIRNYVSDVLPLRGTRVAPALSLDEEPF